MHILVKQFLSQCAIIDVMQSGFYASGFLYDPQSQQILLQQHGTVASCHSPWFLFEGDYEETEQPETLFKSLIRSTLHIKLTSVHPIYTYFNEFLKKHHSVVYAEVERKKEFRPKNNVIYAWFSFKEVIKLQLTEQTKHDIVVGQRVIDAAGRKSRGEHTFQ